MYFIKLLLTFSCSRKQLQPLHLLLWILFERLSKSCQKPHTINTFYFVGYVFNTFIAIFINFFKINFLFYGNRKSFVFLGIFPNKFKLAFFQLIYYRLFFLRVLLKIHKTFSSNLFHNIKYVCLLCDQILKLLTLNIDYLHINLFF